MKYLLFLTFILTICSSAIARADLEIIRLCSSHYPPWTVDTSEQGGELKGISIQSVQAIFKKAGIKNKVLFVNLPFKRCMLDVKHGSLDGSFFLARIKSREVFLVYSEAYAQVKSYFYFNKTTLKDFQWSEWPDLKKYSIGIQRGFKYGAEFSDAIKNESLNIIATNDISQIIRMSLVNRIDLFVTTPLRYSIMEKEYPQFKGKFSFFSGRPVNTGLYYLALSKKSKFLGSLPVINQAIKSLKANRTFRDIIDNQK